MPPTADILLRGNEATLRANRNRVRCSNHQCTYCRILAQLERRVGLDAAGRLVPSIADAV